MTPAARLATAEQSQLVIIDVQDKLIAAMPAKISAAMINNILIIQKASQILNIPSYISEQYPKGLGRTKQSILTEADKKPSIVEKTSFSCANQISRISEQYHKNRSQYILVGMESHICVLQTALHLMSRNKKVFVISDAICSRGTHHYKNALLRMSNAGVVISNTESLLFEWLEDASSPDFKMISKLIR